MKPLSPKSKAVLDRAILHRDRCQKICFFLGEDAADAFHVKHKGDPASDEARKEFEELISGAGN